MIAMTNIANHWKENEYGYRIQKQENWMTEQPLLLVFEHEITKYYWKMVKLPITIES